MYFTLDSTTLCVLGDRVYVVKWGIKLKKNTCLPMFCKVSFRMPTEFFQPINIRTCFLHFLSKIGIAEENLLSGKITRIFYMLDLE